ncbi:MAG: siderophore-interacting protein, partial [Microbacterium sp.]
PEGRVQAFVHGESGLLKTVRPYVRERVERADLSVSAYWRLGETEEGFRRWKSSQDEAIIRPGG